MRPFVEHATGGEALAWQNFTSILTDHEAKNGEVPGLIRDPRGSFHELHGATIELGTSSGCGLSAPNLAISQSPVLRRKEDHLRILQQAGWPQRHDCALMSSKGYASRAARDLIDRIADTAERRRSPCSASTTRMPRGR